MPEIKRSIKLVPRTFQVKVVRKVFESTDDLHRSFPRTTNFHGERKIARYWQTSRCFSFVSMFALKFQDSRIHDDGKYHSTRRCRSVFSRVPGTTLPDLLTLHLPYFASFIQIVALCSFGPCSGYSIFSTELFSFQR